eukprot:g223.t1
MPVSKVYIVHQAPKTTGTILLKGSNLKIEDGISNRYIRIKRTMENIKKFIVPVVVEPVPPPITPAKIKEVERGKNDTAAVKATTTPDSKIAQTPLTTVTNGDAKEIKVVPTPLENVDGRNQKGSDTSVSTHKDTETPKSAKEKSETKEIEQTVPTDAVVIKKKRKRRTKFNPNQLKRIGTIMQWSLEDYFHEVEKQMNVIKLLPSKIITENPPRQSRFEVFKNKFKSASSRLALIFEEILKKIHDAVHIKEVQVGLSWLEAVTFEIFSAIDEVFMIHPLFASTLCKGLMYTWERAFSIGSMIWDSNIQPKFTKQGNIDWRKNNHKANLVYLRFSDKNLSVKDQYVDNFCAWYSQAFYTLQALVWHISIQNKNNNARSPPGINTDNHNTSSTVATDDIKQICINELVETVARIKKIIP